MKVSWLLGVFNAAPSSIYRLVRALPCPVVLLLYPRELRARFSLGRIRGDDYLPLYRAAHLGSSSGISKSASLFLCLCLPVGRDGIGPCSVSARCGHARSLQYWWHACKVGLYLSAASHTHTSR